MCHNFPRNITDYSCIADCCVIIDYTNCTFAFGVDNTNSNIGAKNSIKSRVTQLNPYFVGCPCHSIHNAAQKAAEAFGDLSGIDIEECCIDHFYWFDKSTNGRGS